jgi:OPA family hexose phosphate transport protein UhpT-like MFS transporter
MLNFFELKHPKVLNLPLEVQRQKWMPQFFKAFSVVFTVYFVSYIIRQNMNGAQAIFLKQYSMEKKELGSLLFYNGIAYGIGKFLLGFLADRKNTKKVISFLIVIGGLCNVALGSILLNSSSATTMKWAILIFWTLNGLVLAPGGPCSYSTIMRWMPKSKQSTWLGRWNISHNVGGMIAPTFAAVVAGIFFNKAVGGFFVIPGILAILVGIWGMFFGKDDPMELGWNDAAAVWGEIEDEAERKEEEEEKKEKVSKSKVFVEYVLKNPWVWLLALANIFVYVVRLGVATWVISYANLVLKQEIIKSTTLLGAFELSAMVGSLFLGKFSDKIKGRRMLLSGIVMILSSIGVYFYSKADTMFELQVAMALCGFFIFGPQLLIGVSVVKFVPKKAVAVANGITGTTAYILGDALIAKKILPKFIKTDTKEGWHHMFTLMYISIIIGSILMFIVAIAEEKRIRKDQTLEKNK